jgi:hypothetical protein
MMKRRGKIKDKKRKGEERRSENSEWTKLFLLSVLSSSLKKGVIVPVAS